MAAAWPPEDTMNLKIVEAVYTVVTGEPGHLDQYPYIDSWLGLVQDPPPRMRFCIQKGKGKILMAQKLMIKKRNSTGFGWGLSVPSPMLDDDMPTVQCSTRTRGCLNAQCRARWNFCSSCCSSASSPGDHRATVSAGSDPSNGDLWSTPAGFHLSWTS